MSTGQSMHRGQQVTLLGALGLVGGALLPWVSVTSVFGTISKAGYEGDGLITGGIGLLLLLSAAVSKGKPGQRYSVAGAVFATLAGVLALYDIMDVSARVMSVNSEFARGSLGLGLYVTLASAVAALFGGLQLVPHPAPPQQGWYGMPYPPQGPGYGPYGAPMLPPAATGGFPSAQGWQQSAVPPTATPPPAWPAGAAPAGQGWQQEPRAGAYQEAPTPEGATSRLRIERQGEAIALQSALPSAPSTGIAAQPPGLYGGSPMSDPRFGPPPAPNWSVPQAYGAQADPSRPWYFSSGFMILSFLLFTPLWTVLIFADRERQSTGVKILAGIIGICYVALLVSLMQGS